jgi:uncharacterized protein YndB with AHSA1/START domain
MDRLERRPRRREIEMTVDDKTLATSRLYAHPRERVWQAWTDPTEIGKWWGPHGFTTTTTEMEVRVGGTWRFVMHGPDGRDYQNRVTYTEVQEPVRLGYRHEGAGDTEDIHFDVTVEFVEEAPGSTRLEMRSVFETAPELRRVIEEFGAKEGARQTLERLADHLEATK